MSTTTVSSYSSQILTSATHASLSASARSSHGHRRPRFVCFTHQCPADRRATSTKSSYTSTRATYARERARGRFVGRFREGARFRSEPPEWLVGHSVSTPSPGGESRFTPASLMGRHPRTDVSHTPANPNSREFPARAAARSAPRACPLSGHLLDFVLLGPANRDGPHTTDAQEECYRHAHR